MPRDVEQIVRTHQLAQERRSQGRPIWDRSIPVGNIIARDHLNETDAHAVGVAHEIAALIKARVPASWLDPAHPEFDDTLEEIVEEFAGLTVEEFGPTSSAVDHLNSWLDQLYDWADEKRVWLGKTERAQVPSSAFPSP